MPKWRLARSLEKLLHQIDVDFPTRSRKSDGTIGDARHAKLKSEHNPDKNGVVRAMDITHDPLNGADAGRLVRILFTNKDPRIKYLIYNGLITLPGLTGWKPYYGSNPHNKHFHISTFNDKARYDDSTNWDLLETHFIPREPFVKPTRPYLQEGDRGEGVRTIQEVLIDLGLLRGEADAIYGAQTKAAVIAYQKSQGLIPDGIAGLKTLQSLALYPGGKDD